MAGYGYGLAVSALGDQAALRERRARRFTDNLSSGIGTAAGAVAQGIERRDREKGWASFLDEATAPDGTPAAQAAPDGQPAVTPEAALAAGAAQATMAPAGPVAATMASAQAAAPLLSTAPTQAPPTMPSMRMESLRHLRPELAGAGASVLSQRYSAAMDSYQRAKDQQTAGKLWKSLQIPGQYDGNLTTQQVGELGEQLFGREQAHMRFRASQREEARRELNDKRAAENDAQQLALGREEMAARERMGAASNASSERIEQSRRDAASSKIMSDSMHDTATETETKRHNEADEAIGRDRAATEQTKATDLRTYRAAKAEVDKAKAMGSKGTIEAWKKILASATKARDRWASVADDPGIDDDDEEKVGARANVEKYEKDIAEATQHLEGADSGGGPAAGAAPFPGAVKDRATGRWVRGPR